MVKGHVMFKFEAAANHMLCQQPLQLLQAKDFLSRTQIQAFIYAAATCTISQITCRISQMTMNDETVCTCKRDGGRLALVKIFSPLQCREVSFTRI